MTKRVTIMIDEDVYLKLRKIQSAQILKTPKSVSFSRVLNDTLRRKYKL